MILANTIKGIDIIVGKYSHTTNTGKHFFIGNMVVVQAWEHGLVLEVLDIALESGKIVVLKSQPEEIKPSQMKKNDDVARTVDKYTTDRGSHGLDHRPADGRL